MDGSKSYDGAKMDFELWSPLVRKGGAVVFHDVAHKVYGMREWWQEVKKRFPFEEIIDVSDEPYGIGIIYLPK